MVWRYYGELPFPTILLDGFREKPILRTDNNRTTDAHGATLALLTQSSKDGLRIKTDNFYITKPEFVFFHSRAFQYDRHLHESSEERETTLHFVVVHFI